MAQPIPIDLNNRAQNKMFTDMGGNAKYALTMGTAIDPATGKSYGQAAGGSGSVAIPWVETGGFAGLPDVIKNSLAPNWDGKSYNPFKDVVGYAVDPKTGQIILKSSAQGGQSFPSAYVKTDASGNLARTSAPASEAGTAAAASGASTAPTGYSGAGLAGDPLKLNGVAFTGSYLGMNFINGVSTVSSAAKAERQSAYDSLLAEFNKYGLGSLVTDIKGLIERDVSPSQFIIELRNTPAYQQRFKANTERIKKGLSALSEAQYIQNEDNYRQVLRTYGLTQFDNDEYVNQFLVNDVSPQELGERVTTAVNRLQMADPAVTNTLRTYYGLKDSDMIAAILDPKTQLPTIQRQIAAAEIGTAAGRQGLKIGLPVAEQLAAQGVTKQEAERGYATIAEILPTAEKLSDIYNKELEGYRLPEAEQEVFNTLASAQRKRQRLVERERAAFSGQAGVGRTSLTEDNRAQF